MEHRFPRYQSLSFLKRGVTDAYQAEAEERREHRPCTRKRAKAVRGIRVSFAVPNLNRTPEFTRGVID